MAAPVTVEDLLFPLTDFFEVGSVSENPKRKGVVSLGFCKGNGMSNEEGWYWLKNGSRST